MTEPDAAPATTEVVSDTPAAEVVPDTPTTEATADEAKPVGLGAFLFGLGALLLLVCAIPFLGGVQNIIGIIVTDRRPRSVEAESTGGPRDLRARTRWPRPAPRLSHRNNRSMTTLDLTVPLSTASTRCDGCGSDVAAGLLICPGAIASLMQQR